MPSAHHEPRPSPSAVGEPTAGEATAGTSTDAAAIGPGSVPVQLLPMGESAWLVETDDIDAVLALQRVLAPLAEAGDGVWGEVDDLVPAARTLLVLARPTTDLGELATSIQAAAATASAAASATESSDASSTKADSEAGSVIELPVRYDGPDLDDVARHCGLSAAEVVRAHTDTPWRVGFGGFAPGFAYLVGGDSRLTVPRRPEPRTRVPSGAVGLAGEFSGIYPRESPGGWQLIGSTEAVLWNVDRDPPALLTPGATVRFVEVRS